LIGNLSSGDVVCCRCCRDWVLNNLEGTLVFVRDLEAARHTLSKACKLTRNEKEAWIVESLLAGDCVIQVFNQKKKSAEEKMNEAAKEQKLVVVRSKEVRLHNPSPVRFL
jgi:hypothetical protein